MTRYQLPAWPERPGSAGSAGSTELAGVPEQARAAEPAGMPVDVRDRLLWRDAQQMLDRHAEPGGDGRCGWCGWQWPCPPRRLAERAEAASRRPWRESWTVRHDLNGMRGMPGWRSGGAEPPVRPGRRNERLFD